MSEHTIHTPILQLTDVRKEYGSDGITTEVLHGISLTMEQGEFTALIGPSGSGKSTLLNIIGLLEQPTGGSLLMQGRETGTMPEEELTRLRGKSIGFVFQFHHLIPAFTALENVMLPLMLEEGRLTPEQRERAVWLLTRVGLADRVDFKPGKLSGGQQQRVAIARALAVNPPLVLADEPTGNLDTAAADGIFKLLYEINRESGTTFLIVTHDPRLAKRCSRVVELVDGRVVS
ncbi:lipoprotein-releasing system ATP-binding protein LolD [Geobacter sp. OR-1]|uniref:ABC transporter ATP-binding protein n=1 Tax=Geobacter sp. OR-1 TaxID=1266765 RepID=UPI000541C7FB|nr:ABC transporter ATP-binding protein [Geobacter sp. OR-1]GAM08036.1 lipoprotein-releasing system ATP-binding protein LolD [Geobacter sp. OR-1]